MNKERMEEIEERFYKTGYEINTSSPEPQQIHADLQYLIYTVKEQAERVQELEKEFELYDVIHHKIGTTINNPNTSDDEKREEVNKLLAEAWEGECIHCNGKGFNGLDYCPQCNKGKEMHLEQQNKRYREALEFYADKQSYTDEQYTSTGQSVGTGYFNIMNDGGKKARQALEESE